MSTDVTLAFAHPEERSLASAGAALRHGCHARVRFKQGKERLLVLDPCFIVADDDAPALVVAHACAPFPATAAEDAVASCESMKWEILVAIKPKDTAPGSGWPMLFSARGRARPLSGRSSAVFAAADSAAAAATARALSTGVPPSSSVRKVSRNGRSASTMVLSPGSALPRSVMARTKASTAAAASSDV